MARFREEPAGAVPGVSRPRRSDGGRRMPTAPGNQRDRAPNTDDAKSHPELRKAGKGSAHSSDSARAQFSPTRTTRWPTPRTRGTRPVFPHAGQRCPPRTPAKSSLREFAGSMPRPPKRGGKDSPHPGGKTLAFRRVIPIHASVTSNRRLAGIPPGRTYNK